MWIIYVLGVLLALASQLSQSSLAAVRERLGRSNSAEIQMNFGFYRNAANQYAAANPGFSGTVPRASLGLPAWYAPRPSLSAYVGGSRVLVFEPESDKVSGTRVLSSLSSDTIASGIVIGGQVVSPTNNVLFAAPAGIPENAVVLVIR